MDVKIIGHIFKIALAALSAAIISTGLSPAQMKEKSDKPGASKEIIEMKDDDNTVTIDEKKQEPGADTDKQEQKGDITSDEAPPSEEDEGELEEGKKGPRFKFKGQAKNLYTFHRTDNYYGGNPLTMSSKNLSADLTRARLSPEFQYRELLTIKLDFDNELIWSNYGRSRDLTAYWRPSEYNDFLDLTWEPHRGPDIYYRMKIHRAYVKVSVDKFTATVGRQQIRFGSGKLWNPLDILNPISPTFVEGGDEQKGTDAVKLDFYPEDTTEITAVVDLKKSNNKIERFNLQDCNYIARVKTTVKDADIAILGGYVSRRGVAGFDFAAILFDGLIRGSVIASQAGDSYISKNDPWYRQWYALRYLIPGRDIKQGFYFQANAGYEYTFKKGVYLLVEYFFNQKALNYNKDEKMASYAAQFNAMNQKTYLQLANQFLTVNQHYAAVAIGYDFHPLVRGELFTIGDIQGHGIFWMPALNINAYENLDFTVGMMGAFVFNDTMSDFSEFRKNYLFYASGTYVF
ncbi:MAG: hypothetical protein A2176_02555 [Spirochaetes bacterium RBG_13_51_14]|nr:MAG: hypothetical protein A2176_02555 [Spirochaetes bacterium RBG_13_51_14]